MPSLLSLLWRNLQILWGSADHLLYHLAVDFEYSLWSPLHICLPYLRNIPYIRSAGFRIYTLGLHVYRRSSGCFYFSGIPWNLLRLSAAVFPLAYGYDPGSIPLLWSLLLFFRSTLLVFFLRPLLSFYKWSVTGTSAQIQCDICICICYVINSLCHPLTWTSCAFAWLPDQLHSSTGGSFSSLKYFYPPPVELGVFIMPIRRQQNKKAAIFIAASFGAPSGTRTQDPLIKSQLLYQLS